MSESCQTIHKWFNELKRYSFPFNEQEIPKNGIYILFERGENSHLTDRIVRIGSHTGFNQLRSRLKQHFLKENKDRSIFRKNIGRAILNRDNDEFLEQWELDLTTREARKKYSHLIDFEKQEKIEKLASTNIQNNFSFVVFRIDDKEKRLNLEARIISTVSLCKQCEPTEKWLGLSSPKQKIKESGLWLVNELWKTPLSNDEMRELEEVLF